MNKFLKTGLSVTVLSVTMIAPLQAQVDDRDGFYVSGFAGFAFQEDQTNRSASSSIDFRFDLSFDTGFVAGGSVGYKFPSGRLGGFRLELETSYRENSVESGLIPFGDSAVILRPGDNSSLGILANVLYDFDTLSEAFVPYIGFGLGVGGVESDNVLQIGPGVFEELGGPTQTEFLYQAIAGVTIPLNDTFDLFVDGRYYSALDVDFTLFNSDPRFNSPFDSSYNTFQLQTGVRYRF